MFPQVPSSPRERYPKRIVVEFCSQANHTPSFFGYWCRDIGFAPCCDTLSDISRQEYLTSYIWQRTNNDVYMMNYRNTEYWGATHPPPWAHTTRKLCTIYRLCSESNMQLDRRCIHLNMSLFLRFTFSSVEGFFREKHTTASTSLDVFVLRIPNKTKGFITLHDSKGNPSQRNKLIPSVDQIGSAVLRILNSTSLEPSHHGIFGNVWSYKCLSASCVSWKFPQEID